MEEDARKCQVKSQIVQLNNLDCEVIMFRWKTFLTKHVNKEWSSTFDEDGYGPMYENDYKRLLENHGFKVFVAKPYLISYKLTKVT